MCLAGISLRLAKWGTGQACWSSTRKKHPAQVICILMNWKLFMWNWQSAASVQQMGYTQIIAIAGHCITTTVSLYGAPTASLERHLLIIQPQVTFWESNIHPRKIVLQLKSVWHCPLSVFLIHSSDSWKSAVLMLQGKSRQMTSEIGSAICAAGLCAQWKRPVGALQPDFVIMDGLNSDGAPLHSRYLAQCSQHFTMCCSCPWDWQCKLRFMGESVAEDPIKSCMRLVPRRRWWEFLQQQRRWWEYLQQPGWSWFG